MLYFSYILHILYIVYILYTFSQNLFNCFYTLATNTEKGSSDGSEHSLEAQCTKRYIFEAFRDLPLMRPIFQGVRADARGWPREQLPIHPKQSTVQQVRNEQKLHQGPVTPSRLLQSIQNI